MHVITIEGAEDSRAATEIRALLGAGLLPRFAEQACSAPLGSPRCHASSIALMVDLRAAGRADGWAWCTGWVAGEDGPIWHSWIECHGVVVALEGVGQVAIAPAEVWHARKQARVHMRRNATATNKWMRRHRGNPVCLPPLHSPA